jgi:hypothetical protein
MARALPPHAGFEGEEISIDSSAFEDALRGIEVEVRRRAISGAAQQCLGQSVIEVGLADLRASFLEVLQEVVADPALLKKLASRTSPVTPSHVQTVFYEAYEIEEMRDLKSEAWREMIVAAPVRGGIVRKQDGLTAVRKAVRSLVGGTKLARR